MQIIYKRIYARILYDINAGIQRTTLAHVILYTHNSNCRHCDISHRVTSFLFFRRTSASKKGSGSTPQIEFLSLKATTLVGRGSPSLVLRPFRSTIEGEERMRHSQHGGGGASRGIVGAGNEGSSLG